MSLGPPVLTTAYAGVADVLEKRLRKERKATRQLRDQMSGHKATGSPPPSGHHADQRADVTAPEMGLDLALKPSSSPGDPTRTQTTGEAHTRTSDQK